MRIQNRLMVVFVVLASMTLAASADDKRDAFLEKSVERRAEFIELMTAVIDEKSELLKQAKNGSVNMRIEKTQILDKGKRKIFIFPSKDEKQKYIASAEDAVKGLEKEIEPVRKLKYRWPELALGRLKVGDTGWLHDGVAILQVVDAQNVIVTHQLPNITLWMNIPTKGMTDEESLLLPDAFHVTGTKTYPSANGGSNTVFILAPYAKQETIDKPNE